MYETDSNGVGVNKFIDNHTQLGVIINCQSITNYWAWDGIPILLNTINFDLVRP